MQDPSASPAIKVLQTSALQLPSKGHRASRRQHRRAARPGTASKKRNKSSRRRPTLQDKLAEWLRRLRQISRETAQAYLLKIDGDLGALIKRLGERTDKLNKTRRLKNSSIKQLLKTAKKIDLKPEKGRRKDLRKIEKTVMAMLRIARRN